MSSTDAKWLLADSEVDYEIQLVLFHYGYTSIALLQGLGETRLEVRTLLRDEIGLDFAAALAERRRVATVLAAWESARALGKSELEAKAEAKANRLPRPLGATRRHAFGLPKSPDPNDASSSCMPRAELVQRARLEDAPGLKRLFRAQESSSGPARAPLPLALGP